MLLRDDLTKDQVWLSLGAVVDSEPLKAKEAKAILRTCLGPEGTVFFTPHAKKELENDDMTEMDVLNVLRGGVVSYDGYQRHSHRYRVNTNRFCAVVAFDTMTHTVVVTAWRN